MGHLTIRSCKSGSCTVHVERSRSEFKTRYQMISDFQGVTFMYHLDESILKGELVDQLILAIEYMKKKTASDDMPAAHRRMMYGVLRHVMYGELINVPN